VLALQFRPILLMKLNLARVRKEKRRGFYSPEVKKKELLQRSFQQRAGKTLRFNSFKRR
jgi:hypothetical protein